MLQRRIADTLASGEAVMDNAYDRLGAYTEESLGRALQSQDKIRAEWKNIYTSAAKDAAISPDGANLLLQGYVRSAPRDVVSWMGSVSPTGRDWLMSQAGVASPAALEARIRAEGWGTLQQWVTVDAQGNIALSDGSKTRLGALAELLGRADSVADSVDPQEAKAAVRDVVVRGKDSLKEARGVILRNVDGPTFTRLVSQGTSNLAANEQAALWLSTVEKLNRSPRGAVVQSIAEVEIGAAAQAQVARPEVAAKLPREPTPAGPPAEGSDAGQQQQQMAIAALKAAYPVAGVAAEIVTNAFKAMEQIAVLEGIEQRRSALSQEQARLSMIFKQTTLDSALAEQERRMAAALKQAARAQSKLYAEAISLSGNTAKGLRAEVILQRSLAFYRAERLREEYDRVSAAYALWLWDGTPSKDKISELIQNDPQMLRYALDSDIQLYSWLSRVGESSRADVFQLGDHWEKIKDLVERVRVTQGESPGIDNLGKYDQQTLNLLELLDESQARRLKAWLDKPSQKLILTFTIAPADERFREYAEPAPRTPLSKGATMPAEPAAFVGHVAGVRNERIDETSQRQLKLRNLRLLEVRLAGVYQLSAGAPQYTSVAASLAHPGYAFVARNGAPDRDPYLFQLERRWPTGPRSGLNYEQMTQQSVQRYLHDSDFNSPFLGYSPYTNWTLTLEPTARAPQAIFVAFAYVSLDSTVPRTEADFVKRFQQTVSSFAASTSSKPAQTGSTQVEAMLSAFPVPWFRTEIQDGDKPPVVLSDEAVTVFAGTAPSAGDLGSITSDRCPGEQSPPGVSTGESRPNAFRVSVVCRAERDIATDLVAFFDRQASRGPGVPPDVGAHKRATENAAQWLNRLRDAGVCSWDQRGQIRTSITKAAPGAWLFATPVAPTPALSTPQ
jgi:hypothetical protein